jgi:hypothetical protein
MSYRAIEARDGIWAIQPREYCDLLFLYLRAIAI